jgi:hypothetical protein
LVVSILIYPGTYRFADKKMDKEQDILTTFFSMLTTIILLKMKRLIAIPTMILLLAGGCAEKKQPEGELITVDVTANYPQRELILQDFMDVEYIPLETSDEFICQGILLAVGREIIVVRNRVDDGDIFIFDRNGKGLKKINRKGQGSEEYRFPSGVILDEDKGEIFVKDIRKIIVYDTDWNFKRSFQHKEGTSYDKVFNFDGENLICHDGTYWNDEETNRQSFMVISKQDGSITREIEIPFEKKIQTVLLKSDETTNMTVAATTSSYHPLIPYRDNWILAESSSDTSYLYTSAGHVMTPFMTRTPSVQDMDPVVFLFPGILTDRYYFMEAVKKEYDFEANTGFPNTALMYDRQEKSIYRYTVYNDDYSSKKQVYLSRLVDSGTATWLPLQADQLVESYGKGELKGRLKEIAATLDEESNPVIMLMKYRK